MHFQKAKTPEIYGRWHIFWFVLGFVHLWRGEYGKAIEHVEGALHLGQRCGDLVIQARCLIYLAVAHRGVGNVNEVHDYAVRSLELTSKLAMVEYVAMAKAGLAWVAWRKNNSEEAELLGREALELWHGMEDPYSFDWMALWPLIAVSHQPERRWARDRLRARPGFGKATSAPASIGRGDAESDHVLGKQTTKEARADLEYAP